MDIHALDISELDKEFTVESPAEHLTPGTDLSPWEAGLLEQEPPPPAGFSGLPSSTYLPSAPINRWDPRFVLDLALAIDELPDILVRYGVTEQEFEALSKVPAFRRELAATIRDARENGVTFAAKAKVQAEGYLEILDALVYSDSTPASTRLEAIRSTVKWGRLEPKEEKSDSTAGAQVNIQINF